jgi:hypothetical protein
MQSPHRRTETQIVGAAVKRLPSSVMLCPAGISMIRSIFTEAQANDLPQRGFENNISESAVAAMSLRLLPADDLGFRLTKGFPIIFRIDYGRGIAALSSIAVAEASKARGVRSLESI